MTRRADREPVELCLTVAVSGGCVSYRRTGVTLAAIAAQWPALLTLATAEQAASAAREGDVPLPFEADA